MTERTDPSRSQFGSCALRIERTSLHIVLITLMLCVGGACLPCLGGRLRAEEEPASALVAASIVLEVDAGWPRADLDVLIRGAEDRFRDVVVPTPATAHADNSRRFDLKCPPLEVGHYRIEVMPMNWHAPLTLRSSGPTVLLRIGPPARVVVRLRGPDGRPVAQPGRVLWSWDTDPRAGPGATASDHGVFADPGDGQGVYQFLSAAGQVRVQTEVEGYVDSRSGWTRTRDGREVEIVLGLARAGSITVQIRTDKSLASFQCSVWLEGVDASIGRDNVADEVTFPRIAPGEYIVKLSDLPKEYALPRPVRVSVKGGDRKHVAFDLLMAR